MRERAAALTGCRAFALRGCWVLVAPLVLWAPSGPAAREIATRELRSEWSISKPARALRTLRRPPQQWRMVADRWLGASSRSPARLCRRPPAPRPGPSLRWGCRVFACGGVGVAGAVGSGRPRDRHTRACGSEWSISKPARALRTLRRPPQQWRMVADRWLGASSRSPARPCRCPSVPFTSAASLRPCLRARIGCYFTDRL